ncbi:hypothetical protein [Kosakonia oryziphila]|nr:hypothetical protein [Kosakonia oryziphila]
MSFTPASQAAIGTEISTAEGQSSFIGLFDTVAITSTGSVASPTSNALSFQSVNMGTFTNNGTFMSSGSNSNDSCMYIDNSSSVDLFSNNGYVADVQGETRFTSFGAMPVSDTADIGAGVALVQNDDLSLSARYDLSTAPHFDAQAISLRLRKTF